MKLRLSILLVCLLAAAFSASAQTPEDVAGQVATLWKDNKIPQLGAYLRHLSASSPDYAPAVAAAAFYDYIFLGKLKAAKARLLRISAIAQANPAIFPEVYNVHLAAAVSEINSDIEVQIAHGKTEFDWQASANPQAVRNLVGTRPLPILVLIFVTPKVTLPAS